MSPSPAPVAAFRTATWWVSLWVSTPATTQGSSSDRSRVRVPAVSVIMMMRLPRGGRAGRGRADRTLTGLSKLVSGHAGPRPAPVGRRPAGTRTDHDQGRPRGRQSNSGSHAPAGQALTFSTSKSVAKAPRDRIGREKKRGISTILLRRSGPIGAFATDLDNRPSGRLNERPELRPRWGAWDSWDTRGAPAR